MRTDPIYADLQAGCGPQAHNRPTSSWGAARPPGRAAPHRIPTV